LKQNNTQKDSEIYEKNKRKKSTLNKTEVEKNTTKKIKKKINT